MAPPVKVAICVPTYKRPLFLCDTLLSIENRLPGDFESFVLVADNDPAFSARSTVVPFMEREQGILLIHQPTRGLATVRNTLVAEATKMGATLIAFVDDDQLAAPDWLNRLVCTARETKADAVVGRWIPRYEDGVPEWVKRSGYWDQPARETGTIARKFGTGNVLLRLDAVNSVPGLFDERLNLVGGEDGHFFVRFHQLGFRSVWCNDSVVEERIPPSRTTAKWIISREYRYGTNTGFIVRTVSPSPRLFAYRMLTAAGYAAVFALASIVSLPFGKARWVPNAARVARGVGLLAGLFGGMHREYATVHGR